MAADYDIIVVGGGINGCGVARDAAGRGYTTCLFERADLASGTSSCSTKLIHGGLRYLEHYEFRLVRESLIEREVLWRLAPHIIWPLRFILPHHKGLRPAWLLRLALFLYDHLGGRVKLPATAPVALAGGVLGAPLKAGFDKGFEYSDCWVQDSRLVALNARDAAALGARIETRCAVTRIWRDSGKWRVSYRHGDTGAAGDCTARLVVNAAGPWVDEVMRGPLAHDDAQHVRLVKGSHIVVPRLYDHDRAYIFQNGDGRIVFAIPYEDDFTLIGTTDEDFTGDPGDAAISARETDYLCQAASVYFAAPITPERIVWSYSGVRPLFDDGASKAQETTRDYVIRQEGEEDEPKLINIFGGKITTYRRLAEAVLDEVEGELGARRPPWTAHAPLPGGDFEAQDFDRLVNQLRERHPALPAALARRLTRAYGTNAREIMTLARGDLGRHFGAGLYEAEVKYLMQMEFARTAEDVLWRRSKLGLHMGADQVAALQDFMQGRAMARSVGGGHA